MADAKMLGKYRLLDSLEQGANEHVHLAWDTRLNQRVILHVLPSVGPKVDQDGSTFRAFIKVVQRLSRLQHSDILTPIQYASLRDEKAWYVTEPAEGVNFEQILKKRGVLPWLESALLLHQLASVIAFAHGEGIAHGQLAPRRVVIGSDGRIGIGGLDVLGRVLLARPERDSLDLSEIYADFSYLAPEALQRRLPQVSADVFVMGIILFELVTGKRPFDGPSAIQSYVTARGPAKDPSDHIADIDPEFRDLLRQMLSARAEKRPANGAMVRDACQKVLQRQGVTDARAKLKELIDGLWSDVAGESSGPAQSAARSERPSGPRNVLGSNLQANVQSAIRAAQIDIPMRAPTLHGAQDQVEGADAATQAGPAQAAAQSMPDAASAAIAQLEVLAQQRQLPTRTVPTRMAGVLMGFVVLSLLGALPLFIQTSDRPGVAASLNGSNASAAEEGELVEEERSVTPQIQPEELEIELAEPAHESAVEVYRAKAEKLLVNGQAALAERMARRAISSSGRMDRELFFLLGQSLDAQGKVDEARNAYIKSDGASGKRIRGHQAAGFMLAKDGRCPEAIAFFEGAAKRAGTSPTLRKLTGNCLLIMGRWTDAREALEEAARLMPKDLDVLVPLGLVYEKEGGRARARGIYERILLLDPDNRGALEGIERIDSGRELVQAALGMPLEQGPESDEVLTLYKQAKNAFLTRDFALAALLYQRVLTLTPQPDFSLLRDVAIALDEAGDAKQAARAYIRVLKVKPQDDELSFLYGRWLVRHGQPEKALKPLSLSMEKKPSRWQAHFELGVAYLTLDRPADAAKAFEKVLSQRPNDLSVLKNLGKAQVESGAGEGALQTFGRLAEIKPNDPGPVLTMAAIMQRMDRRKDADTLLEEACRRGAEEACR